MKNEEIFESGGGEEAGAVVAEQQARLRQVRDALAYKSTEGGSSGGAISSESLHPERAFEVFGGKTYLGAPAEHFSLADSVERRVESPLQRFARLRGELDDLSKDLDEMVKEDINEEASVWSVLQRDARGMIQSLLEMEHHDGFQVHQRKTNTMAQRLEQVSAKIADSARVPEVATAATGAARAGGGGGSQADLGSSASELLSLEKRVAALETTLGYSSNLLDTEGSLSLAQASLGGTFPLVDAIVRLERRVALLDPPTLDLLRTKSAALRADLEATGKLKSASHEGQALETARRVDEALAQLERVRVVADEAPALIVRLKTLETIHSSAALFAQRLDAMESSVGALAEELRSNGDVLGALQLGLAENSKTFRDNLAKMGKGK